MESKKSELPQLIQNYKAFEDNKRSRLPRFRIVLKDGTVHGFAYSYLISWVFDPPTLLTLTLGDKIVSLTGQNLKRIESLLLEEKIKALFEFDEKKHQSPKGNEAIIESIEIN